MFARGCFDSLTLVLAADEPLPGTPKPLPAIAPHLTDYLNLTHRGERVETTIDPEIQSRAAGIINIHQKNLSGNFINNSACVIIEVSTGDVLAYIGNSLSENPAVHNGDVDVARAYRSTGSILKPLLYAGMQNSGEILPNTLVADIPTRFSGFSPKNFDLSFSGAVPASNALSQSLNIPAVKMLQKFSAERFLALLERTGFTSFDKTADHYGLSLILGGGETSLLELTGVYASLSRVLWRYNNDGKYYIEDYHPPFLISQEYNATITEDPDPPLSASSIWLTYEALRKVNRPESEAGWQYFSSSPNIAWKTGTSFGFRDAWAVGTTPGYVIGVWAGNADGEGRPGLTGITVAAPILFDLAGMMGTGEWFKEPSGEMTVIKVCSKSGFRAGPDCNDTGEINADVNGLKSEVCPYHRIIHLDKSRTRQVNADCADAADIINESWFVLPPAMEYFFRQKHPEYRVLPPYAPGCMPDKNITVMEFIYPSSGIKIFIPRDQSGRQTRIIPEVAHRNPSKKIFWHLDEEYITTTRFMHQIEILAEPGPHTITAVDEDGNTLKSAFTISGTIK
jgi:penicillin-binding protein 1C